MSSLPSQVLHGTSRNDLNTSCGHVVHHQLWILPCEIGENCGPGQPT